MLRLEMLRKEMGLSQLDLAKKLNMTQQRISAYEKIKHEPDIETLKLFADFFNVSVDYFLGKTDIRNYDDIDKNLLNIGLNKNDYNPPTKEQQEKIDEFARFVLKDNLKKKEDK